jgi:hypothetical protein
MPVWAGGCRKIILLVTGAVSVQDRGSRALLISGRADTKAEDEAAMGAGLSLRFDEIEHGISISKYGAVV